MQNGGYPALDDEDGQLIPTRSIAMSAELVGSFESAQGGKYSNTTEDVDNSEETVFVGMGASHNQSFNIDYLRSKIEEEIRQIEVPPSSSLPSSFPTFPVPPLPSIISPALIHPKGTKDDPYKWNPKKSGDLVNEYDQSHYYVLAYPWLFAAGVGGAPGDITIPRPLPIKYPEWIKYLLMYPDRRFVQDETFLFDVDNRMDRHTMANTMSVVVSKEGVRNLHVRDLKEMLLEDDNTLLSKAFTYSSSIPGTSGYWRNFLMNLRALSDFTSPGCFHFFFTASAADYEWHDQYSLIAQQYGDIDDLGPGANKVADAPYKQKRYNAAVKNPHLSTWYFGVRFRLFFDNVLTPLCGFTDFVYRHEFQEAHAADHVHGGAVAAKADGLNSFHRGDLRLAQFLSDRKEQQKHATAENLSDFDKAFENEYNDIFEEFLDYVQKHIPFSAILDDYFGMVATPRAQSENVMAWDMRLKNFEDIVRAKSERLLHCMRHSHRPYCLQPINKKLPTIAYIHLDNSGSPPWDLRTFTQLCAANLKCRFFCPHDLVAQCYFDSFANSRPLRFVWSNKSNRITMIVTRNDGMVNINFVIFVDGYNSNVDLTIISNKEGFENYVAAYTGKSESMSKPMKDIFQTLANTGKIHDDDPILKGIVKTAFKTIGNRDKGKQEISRIRLGLGLSYYSRDFVQINLYETSTASIVLNRGETEQDGAGGADFDPDDVAGAIAGLKPAKFTIVDFYSTRGHENNELVRKMCLYDFASIFQLRKDGNLSPYTKRKCPRIFPRLECIVDQTRIKFENWCRIQCILYLPWRLSYDSLLEDLDCWMDVFEFHIAQGDFPVKIANIYELASLKYSLSLVEPDDAEENNDDGEGDSEDDDDDGEDYVAPGTGVPHDDREGWMFLAALGQNQIIAHEMEAPADDNDWSTYYHLFSKAMETVNEWSSQIREANNVEQMSYATYDAATLTEDQKWAFFLIMSQDIALNEALKKGEELPNPLYLDIEGTAGSGKSYLIHTVNKYLRMRNPSSCLNLAPTGTAAANINGSTTFRQLHLPVKKMPFQPLFGKKLSNFQQKLEYVNWIPIDEKSMIGLKQWGRIGRRLQQASNNSLGKDRLLGKFNIIKIGDTAQLPPVGDTASYISLLHRTEPIKVLGKQIQRLFENNVVVLHGSKRHQGESQTFIELLHSLRDANINEEQYKMLQTRFESKFGYNERKQFKHPHNFFGIYPYHKQVDQLNLEALEKLDGPICILKASHPLCPGTARRASSSVAMNLHSTLKLKVGSKVMLKKNIWTEGGLTNGSMGVVRYILSKSPDSPVTAILVCFSSFKSRDYFSRDDGSIDEKLVAIVRTTEEFEFEGKQCSRCQFPLTLADGLTGHITQGMTIKPPKNVYIDLGDKEMAPGLSFTMLSRTENLSQMMIKDFEIERINKIATNPNFKSRLDYSLKLEETYKSLQHREAERYNKFWMDWPEIEKTLIEIQRCRHKQEAIAEAILAADAREEQILVDNPPPSLDLSDGENRLTREVLDGLFVDVEFFLHLLILVKWIPESYDGSIDYERNDWYLEPRNQLVADKMPFLFTQCGSIYHLCINLYVTDMNTQVFLIIHLYDYFSIIIIILLRF